MQRRRELSHVGEPEWSPTAEPEAPHPNLHARRRRPHLLAWAAVAMLLLLGWHFEASHLLIRMMRIVGQSSSFMSFRLLVSPGARRTHAKAQRYFEEQYPLVEESARNFKVHWYFSHTRPPAGKAMEEIGWYDMIGERTRALARLLVEHQRDDFRVEKDRCEMYRFFARAGLPHAKVVGIFNDTAQLPRMVRDMTLYAAAEAWPVFMKACHLTQGSMQAVLQLKSKAWAEENKEEVVAWMESKLSRKADDWERPWREEGNMLTDVLAPGMMLQEGWHLAYNPYKKKDTVFELKVEVLWGRAYLAVGNDIRTGTIFLRDGSVELFMSHWDQLMFAASHDIETKWIHSHLDCVWKLAERAAAIIGCECVRIDVFLWKGHPNECTLNEISISSGMQYAMHFPFLARAWAGPLVKREFQVADTRTPVYLGRQSLQSSPSVKAG